MSEWVVGYIMGMAVGIGAGFAIGFAAGKPQKPWSELTEQEKRLRKFLIGAGIALLVLGAIVFVLFEFGLYVARWKFFSPYSPIQPRRPEPGKKA